MKQTTNQVITRTTSELNDLTCRINSLERFLITEDFTEVSANQKVLLAQQHTAMEQYKEILLKRLVDLRNQEKREALEEQEPRAPMCKCAMVETETKDGTPTD